MKLKLVSVLVAGLLSAAPAMSSPVTLDFEGIATNDSVGNFYQSLGVSFGADALAFVSDASFPFASNLPSGSTAMSAVGDGNASLVALGSYSFTGEVAFSYSSDHATSVDVLGLDGSTVIATFNLANNAQSDGCSDTPFCHWNRLSMILPGAAKAIRFGDALFAGIDDVTVNAVPLPAAAWLLLSGLSGFGALMRRKSKA